MQKSEDKTSLEEEEIQPNPQEITDTLFNGKSDICQQLFDRYGRSSASQHRHLCATAAAARSVIQSESLPLSPLSYFAAAIDAISDPEKSFLDAEATSALSSFLSIVLPLVHEKAIPPKKAVEAISTLVEFVKTPSETRSTACVRAVVKCLGVLVIFCDLEDWGSLEFGFQTLLNFSLDKRPKVRKCAQECVLKAFKSPNLTNKASKSVYSLLKNHMPEKDGIFPKPEHQEALHLLNLLKHISPYLSEKVCSKVILLLKGLIAPQFSALAKDIFYVIEVVLESSRTEVMTLQSEDIMDSLISYVSMEKGNPSETTLFATTLFVNFYKKFHASDSSKWIIHLSLFTDAISGLLTSGTSIASLASNTLKELIRCLIDRRKLLNIDNNSIEGKVICSQELSAVVASCASLDILLRTCPSTSNEHIFGVISVMFLTLGETSYAYLKHITLKLADMMAIALENNSNAKHLEVCFGSAVIAMGPEKLLSLIPISLNFENLACSNIWMLPILKDYVIGSRLGFFIEHIVPLAESFEQAHYQAKGTVTKKGLWSHACSCWELLPAFCRYPTDVHRSFDDLFKFIIPHIKKGSFMIENICIALKELINQNRSVFGSYQGGCTFAKPLKMVEVKDFVTEYGKRSTYSEKMASKNIRTLTLYSEDLFRALTNVFFESSSATRDYLKDAIGCLVPIVDSSICKSIFISSIERFHLMNDLDECETLGVTLVDEEQNNSMLPGMDSERCLVLELVSSFVEGASEDLISLIFAFIKHNLQEADGLVQNEAYHTLKKLVEGHSKFCSLKSAELLELLLVLKPPVDINALKSRFACFRILLVDALERSSGEENKPCFLILNEIILTLKDSKEDGRKVASDVILESSTGLQKSSSKTTDGPFQRLMNMMLGYLSSSSPHIKSGAVSALSILVYNDANICKLMPDLVPSVLALLQCKDVEVIKAGLGFVKVVVSSLKAEDMRAFLSDILNGVLQWSSTSRHHFRSKVSVILEIMMRKFGSGTINLCTPAKYGDFIKSVLKNRQGKTMSKEDDATKPLYSSTRRQQKRKNEHLGVVSQKEGSFPCPKRRKTDKKSNDTASSKTNKKSNDITSCANERHLSRTVNEGKRAKDMGRGNINKGRMRKIINGKVAKPVLGGKKKMMKQAHGSQKNKPDAQQPFSSARNRHGVNKRSKRNR